MEDYKNECEYKYLMEQIDICETLIKDETEVGDGTPSRYNIYQAQRRLKELYKILKGIQNKNNRTKLYCALCETFYKPGEEKKHNKTKKHQTLIDKWDIIINDMDTYDICNSEEGIDTHGIKGCCKFCNEYDYINYFNSSRLCWNCYSIEYYKYYVADIK